MPKSRAVVIPATPGLSEITTFTLAARRCSRQARAIVAMLEPRPEMSIASRKGLRADDNAVSAFANFTNHTGALAAGVQQLDGFLGTRARNDGYHPDSAVERAVHF